MDKTWTGTWICDPLFADLEPIDVFRREQAPPLPCSHREDLKNHHMLVRKTFTLKAPFDRVEIDITADDMYKLSVNGEPVGQGPAPSYPFHYAYSRYDLTRYVQSGRNVIAVHVYYQGLVNRVWNSGDYRQGLIADLLVDGETAFGTDPSWKTYRCQAYRSGGIVGYDTQFLENIDMRQFPQGWREMAFDDLAWRQAARRRLVDYTFYRQETPPPACYTVVPQVVRQTGPGCYWIDFGHELTGQFAMRAKGRAGQDIVIMHGEELDAAGQVRYEMRCNCRYRETWTLAGNGWEELPFFDYKAFRYVALEGCENAADPESFACVVRHYPLDENACRFQSSDDLLNRVWDICKRGVQFGAQEVFVDCPSREKGQYLGDMTITGLSHLYVSGDLRLYKKGLQDFACSARITPDLMAVAPGSLMQEVADYSLQWPQQLLTYFVHSGDSAFLQDQMPVVEGLEQAMRRYEHDDGLLWDVTDKWNLVDWPANLRDNYDFDLSRPVGPGCHNVINAFYGGMKASVNGIRNALGLPVRSTAAFKDAFVRAFYDPQRRLFVDAKGSRHASLHANILPLLFGLAPREAVPVIVGLIQSRGMRCGVYMAYFLLKALAAAKAYDVLCEQLVSTSEHSWANMLREGATTCFEAWGKDQKWNTSLCHPWASAPIPVLIEDLVGLTPAEPGWKKIRFDPHLPAGLKQLELTIKTPAGPVCVRVQDGRATLRGPAGVPVLGG
ncbi:MAG: family 78 glycoside hydrolase catalytic domain [Eubacteriales bacterium]|nr:family 78 glycoside hydrolase catalytic domain [Eubacteriales bacterium]